MCRNKYYLKYHVIIDRPYFKLDKKYKAMEDICDDLRDTPINLRSRVSIYNIMNNDEFSRPQKFWGVEIKKIRERLPTKTIVTKKIIDNKEEEVKSVVPIEPIDPIPFKLTSYDEIKREAKIKGIGELITEYKKLEPDNPRVTNRLTAIETLIANDYNYMKNYFEKVRYEKKTTESIGNELPFQKERFC